MDVALLPPLAVAVLLFTAGVATLRAESERSSRPRVSPALPGVVDPTLPSRVTDLPPGDADRGRQLFWTKHGCALCHGDPTVPGSELRAPGLGSIAGEGATRIPGMDSAQYVFESITNPDAFLVEAPVAPDGTKLEQMPVPTLTAQEAADLVAFLMNDPLEGTSPSAAGPEVSPRR